MLRYPSASSRTNLTASLCSANSNAHQALASSSLPGLGGAPYSELYRYHTPQSPNLSKTLAENPVEAAHSLLYQRPPSSPHISRRSTPASPVPWHSALDSQAPPYTLSMLTSSIYSLTQKNNTTYNFYSRLLLRALQTRLLTWAVS